MDGPKFDALARFVATPRTRRQLVRALGGGLLAGLAGGGRTGAAACPSGVVCSARCCPYVTDICLAGRCTSCRSGVVCSARCCAAGEECLSGRCTSCPSGVICSGACCAAGETCQAGQCAAAATTTPPATTPPPVQQPGPCGGSGAPCVVSSDCCAPYFCAAGACATSCPAGSTACERPIGTTCDDGACCLDRNGACCASAIIDDYGACCCPVSFATAFNPDGACRFPCHEPGCAGCCLPVGEPCDPNHNLCCTECGCSQGNGPCICCDTFLDTSNRCCCPGTVPDSTGACEKICGRDCKC